MSDIKKQYKHLLTQIRSAENAAKKPANSVTLLAVSKTRPVETLRLAAEAGQNCFGENYLQEALIKINALTDLNLEWHFIGPIQSNKTKDIATHFDWVHSVDRDKIIQRLASQRPAKLSPLNICIQVNIDNEPNKSGVDSQQIMTLAAQITQQERLCLRGLMIIPTAAASEMQQRSSFQQAHQLFTELAIRYDTVDTLSMGMSADMALAIAEGSTLVRIGTGLFGKRSG
jgi:pyridoxal phosphate enzyme (YggS family)